jgi:CBS domain-containing protein
MLVSNILGTKGTRLVTAAPGQTVRTVARLLRLNRIGAVPVIDDDGHLVGMLSERDITYRLATDGEDVLSARVADLMTVSVVTCGPADDLKYVMAEMTDKRFRHLPVLEDGAIVGIVSIGDVVKARLDEAELEVSVLRDYARATVA